jgi:hypothetical protein
MSTSRDILLEKIDLLEQEVKKLRKILNVDDLFYLCNGKSLVNFITNREFENKTIYFTDRNNDYIIQDYLINEDGELVFELREI